MSTKLVKLVWTGSFTTAKRFEVDHCVAVSVGVLLAVGVEVGVGRIS